MAGPSGRGAPRAPKAAGATLEACLEDVKAGAPSSVYLLDGDAFLSLRAARELVAALVPEAQRALNVVEADAATSPAEIAAELATGGLFGGSKVVLLVEPAFLTSKEEVGEAFARARGQWEKGAQRDGARRVLALAAKAGWQAKDLVADAAPDLAAFEKDLDLRLGPEDQRFVQEAAAWAVERELKVGKDDGGPLEELLERGLPRGHVLVVAAGKVDGRLPLVKKLAAAGRRVTSEIANVAERPWDPARYDLAPVIADLLAGTGKKVDAAGQARLAALVADDARTLASEVAKLAAYAGDRKVITAEDVDAVVTRVAEDEFFALGNAVEARDLPATMGVLDRAFADGVTPYQLVGMLAGTVRRLVVERERARRVAGEEPIRSSRDWEARVFPEIPEEERKGKKPYGFWMKYQASLRFGRGELLSALAALADADVAMKSGFDGRLALERLLLGLLGQRGA
ncbi:MAG: DNA polymerase III subunit delta [Anaeromyxobacter sp.]